MNDTMKNHVLIAWYGITDLRAAMGTEDVNGPILGALATGRYTHSCLLAYTKKDLSDINTTEQDEYASLLNANRDANRSLSEEEIYNLVQRFANTPKGHEFYFSWLRRELDAQNRSIPVEMQECFLEKLNDSHGIYIEALKAIEHVRQKFGNTTAITLFISPGTPVMAFSWAFASLVNSDMNITILVSPDSRKGFETVSLPYQLTDVALKNTNLAHPKKFDVIFHLYGEQVLPSALGILQFPETQKHIFICSKGFTSIRRLRSLLRDKTADKIEIEPFSPQNVKEKILGCINVHPEWQNIGFNLTGGTKLMYAGAFAACGQCFGVPFYFENKTHKLMWLNDYTTEEMTGIQKIDDFFSISEMVINRPGYWNNDPGRGKRVALTNVLWKKRSKISNLYKRLSEYNDQPGKPFEQHLGEKICFKLDSSGKAMAHIDERSYEYDNFPDFAKYITGGWLEEFTWLQLKPLLDVGTITDIRIGMTVTWAGEQVDTQEFDVIFTDSKRLYILECKAGSFKAIDIQKLQNNVRNYGGIDGRGTLIACFPPFGESANSMRKRIQNSQNLSMFTGENIPEKLPALILNSFGNIY